MQLRNSATRYGAITKSLHWAVFVLVVAQFAGGFSGAMDEDTHALLGGLLLALVLVRLSWRTVARLPTWAPTLSAGERRLAHWTELALYLCLLAKPLTGIGLFAFDRDDIDVPFLGEFEWEWESDYWEDFFGSAHALSGYALLLAITIHLSLVLKHQFVNRDRLANRMLPFTRQ